MVYVVEPTEMTSTRPGDDSGRLTQAVDLSRRNAKRAGLERHSCIVLAILSPGHIDALMQHTGVDCRHSQKYTGQCVDRFAIGIDQYCRMIISASATFNHPHRTI